MKELDSRVEPRYKTSAPASLAHPPPKMSPPDEREGGREGTHLGTLRSYRVEGVTLSEYDVR